MTLEIHKTQFQSVPSIMHELVGRENEMKTIISHFNGSEFDVITLYGSPGFGKSEIAIHVGHKMMELGFKVHYIRVQDIPNVDILIRKLIVVSNSDVILAKNNTDSLKEWARSIETTTLLILDNVDGHYWVREYSRNEIQHHFIEVLCQYSTSLKILVTSQTEIRSECKYWPLQLPSLALKDCIHLLNNLVRQSKAYLSDYESKYICESIDNIPLAVKVLVGSFLFPFDKNKEEVPNDKLMTIEFLKNNLPFQFDDRLESVFNHSFFYFVRPECKISSLLLYKFRGLFSLDDAISLLSYDMMKNFTDNGDFKAVHCIQELSTKSFIERRLLKNQVRYNFHSLVRSFLNDARHQYQSNLTRVLRDFWPSYFNWLGEDYEVRVQRPIDAFQEDIDIFIELLHQNDYNVAVNLISYERFNSPLFSWDSLHFLRNSLHKVFELAANVLLSDCKNLAKTTYTVQISDIISAYINIFSKQYSFWNLDNLLECELKVEQLHSLAKGDGTVGFSSSYFHNYLVDETCLKISNQHEICENRWEYRLLDLNYDFILTVQRRCKMDLLREGCVFFDSNTDLTWGLRYYATIDDINARHYLLSALDSKPDEALLTAIAHIALYSIASRRGDSKGKSDSLSQVRQLYSDMSMSCYSPLYGTLVIPFLRSVNETQLANKLCGILIESHENSVQKTTRSAFLLIFTTTHGKLFYPSASVM